MNEIKCFKCGRSNGREERSSCDFKGDRDIVGATNILSKGMYSPLQNIHRDEVVPLEVSL